MISDPYSPIAPARVRVLLLPVGAVRHDRFALFARLLHAEHIVSLRDITADKRPDRTMFSPMAYPDGSVFLDFATHLPPQSHTTLAPLELFRETLIVVGIMDASTHTDANANKHSEADPTLAGPDSDPSTGPSRKSSTLPNTSSESSRPNSMHQNLSHLQSTYPKALTHHILVFEHADATTANSNPAKPDELVFLPPLAQHKRTTIKTVVCDITSLFLGELMTLARSIEAQSSLDTPGRGPATRIVGLANTDPSYVPPSTPTPSTPASASASASASAASTPTPTPLEQHTSVGNRSQSRMSMPPVSFKNLLSQRNSLMGSPLSSSTSSTPAPVTSPTPSLSEVDVRPRSGSDAADGLSTLAAAARGKNRLVGRKTMVLGSLYLVAGRWEDALKELTEAATMARSVNDHVWHGKALELIVCTCILLGWAGLKFQVPSVCLPPPEKSTQDSSSKSRMSVFGTGSSSTAAATPPPSNAPPNTSSTSSQPVYLQSLQTHMTDLLDRILGLYTRLSSENLSLLSLSDAIIRFSKILTFLYLSEGNLDKRALDAMVHGPETTAPVRIYPRLSIQPSRKFIASLLLRAFPAQTELLSLSDRVTILGGIAAVLGMLGFQRKKGFVVQELMAALVTGLMEARTKGAADMGIHPAAGLVALSGSQLSGASSSSTLELQECDKEVGLEAFLRMICRIYGVTDFDLTPWQSFDQENSQGPTPRSSSGGGGLKTIAPPLPPTHPDAYSDAAVLARIQRQSASRLFGLRQPKLNILRLCINFADALPDLRSVVRFSSDLLRTSGCGMAAGPLHTNAGSSITREEQLQLMTNIHRTVDLAHRLGFRDVWAEYWDEFLVREVYLETPPLSRKPTLFLKKTPRATPTDDSQSDGNIIFNPFQRSSRTKSMMMTEREKAREKDPPPPLVAQEAALFRVVLQNPYDIEVEIERFQIETEGVPFECRPLPVTLGPYRTQVAKVLGRPLAAGALKLTGALVKIKGCRERRFPIIADSWVPVMDPKMKARGLPALDYGLSLDGLSRQPPPRLDQVQLQVVPSQPFMVAECSASVPQSSMMLLEGEKRAFSVRLDNQCPNLPINFIRFTFEDSTQAALKTALENDHASQADLYEYEDILTHHPAVRLLTKLPNLASSLPTPKNDGTVPASSSTPKHVSELTAPLTYVLPKSHEIASNGSAEFDLELDVAGKPGLSFVSIHMDYGYVASAEDLSVLEHDLYVRRTSVSLHVTVNASVELSRMDLLPLSQTLRWTDSEGQVEVFSPEEYCLLSLDLRNAWPSNMTTHVTTCDTDSSTVQKVGRLQEGHILPGHIGRVLLPIQRVYLENPYAPIPRVQAQRRRQYVVSASSSPEAQRSMREAFWFRKRLLENLHVTWSVASGDVPRSGVVELRAIKLTPRMLEALRIDEVSMTLSITETGSTEHAEVKDKRREMIAKQPMPSIRVDSFAQLHVRLRNRSAKRIFPLLRLLPSLPHPHFSIMGPHGTPGAATLMDLSRKLSWNGVLQHALPPLEANGGETAVTVDLTPLSRGTFVVMASVEEAKIDATPSNSLTDEQAWGWDKDELGSLRERRVWHLQQPFVFEARDA